MSDTEKDNQAEKIVSRQKLTVKISCSSFSSCYKDYSKSLVS